MALTNSAAKALAKQEAQRAAQTFWQRQGPGLARQLSNAISVLVVTTEDGGGTNAFKGKIINAPCQGKADASQDFLMPMGPATPPGTPCVIWDLAKSGRPGHRIPSGSYLLGQVVGFADDGATPLVLADYGRDAVFRVDLTKDGGADGDDSNPPTYTYSATYRDTSSAGTQIELLAQRPNGSFTAATIGIGHDTDDGFVLMWCDEIPATDTCGPAMGENLMQFYAAQGSAPQPAMTRYMAATFH